MALNHNLINKISEEYIENRIQERFQYIKDNIYVYNLYLKAYERDRDKPKIVMAKSIPELYIKILKDNIQLHNSLFMCYSYVSPIMKKYEQLYNNGQYDWLNYVIEEDRKYVTHEIVVYMKHLEDNGSLYYTNLKDLVIE